MKNYPFIQNVSRRAIEVGDHYIGKNSYYIQSSGSTHLDDTVLISINDPLQQPPNPHYVFKDTRYFEFLDLEEADFSSADEFKIQYEQAEEIIKFLQESLEKGYNVIVHCTVGLCRSGAVAEVGVMMGFSDTGTYRQPNMMVKNYLLKVLDWKIVTEEDYSNIFKGG